MHAHLDPGLLAFLRDPASYPHRPREVTEVRTHASLVFIAPPFVYKIKKPVDFGFLDFSSLEKRRHFCHREVELNSRLAPGVYLGVVPITRERRGFAFSGKGAVVEYAVKMRHLAPGGFLDARMSEGSAGKPELDRVARKLADFYQKQPSPPEIAVWGSIAKLRISTDENFAQTRPFVGMTISRQAFDAIRAFTGACYERRRALFEQRAAGGWIRDCHGDLHLDHIHLMDGEPLIYDCIEFNDRFRHLDVASDAAFLAMDLDYHGRPDLARYFTRRLAVLMQDPEMERMMDFYQCYRAYVRDKVESLHSVAEIGGDGERADAAANARRHFQLALQYAVSGTHPVAIVCMGRVATGKSTLAAALAHELGWQVISSDTLRKSLAGAPLHARGDSNTRRALYSPDMTARTYQSMVREAREILEGGHGVILDATFSKRAFRDLLRKTINGKRLMWIVTGADDATTAKRLMMREECPDVVSDARLEDRPMLEAAYEVPDELPAGAVINLSTDAKPEKALHRLLAAMVAMRAAPAKMRNVAAVGRASRELRARAASP